MNISTDDSISWELDDLGKLAVILIDSSIYSKIAIFKNAYWYTEKCYIFISNEKNSKKIRVEIRIKDEMKINDLESISREFCNGLIDFQVRQDVIQETSTIRDELLKKAFSEGRSHSIPGQLISDESLVPSSEESYEEDPLDISRSTSSKNDL